MCIRKSFRIPTAPSSSWPRTPPPSSSPAVPSSVYAEGAPSVGADLFEAGVPVFGICYGFQAMANALGGKVDKTGLREYGSTETTILGEGRSVLDGHAPAPEHLDEPRRLRARGPGGLRSARHHGRAPKWRPSPTRRSASTACSGTPRSSTRPTASRCWRTSCSRAPSWNRTGPRATSSKSRWSASASRSATPGSSAASPAALTPQSPPPWSSAPSATS